MIKEEILELVRGRSSPGVMILDRSNTLLYANQEAVKLLKDTREIPQEIRNLCDAVKAAASSDETGDDAEERSCALLWQDGSSLCSLRGFLLGAQANGMPATHVMILIEKVTEQHGPNLNKAKTQFGLSDREVEVVALVGQGLANKEIGARLFLSEHTIKDHIKNIMKKMNAASRSEIIYLLK